MQISIASEIPKSKELTLITFHTTGDRFPVGVTAKEFSGEEGSHVVLREAKRRTILVGLGERAKLSAPGFKRAAGLAIKSLQKSGVTSAVLDLTEFPAHVRNVTEGAIVGAYFFDTFLPLDRQIAKRFEDLVIAVGSQHIDRAVHAINTGSILGEAVNFTRSLGDLPGNYVVPQILASTAQDLAKTYRNLKVTIFDENRLAREKFGGLLAVGTGSARPPRLIVIEYHGGKKGERPIALVGKAITFDSGGISIKPADKMDEMKYDKMGGCAVLGIMQAVARLRLKKNIVAVIASAENSLGPEAYRPGDIITTYDGKTIEVLNTDAEGRIVLADALGYVRLQHHPAEVIDFATLTGACVVALGSYRAGLFSNNRPLAESLKQAAEASGDLVWELPHDAPYHAQIKSDVALVKNTGGREGGASTAAAFLEKWVEDLPWAHLDIAGTAWSAKELPHLTKGATGFGVSLMLDHLMR